jgi:hypothetical protein
MGPCPIALLLILGAGSAWAQSNHTQPPVAPTRSDRTTVPAKPIFLPPPLQWDHAMVSFRPALQQTANDFANLTGGIAFGMSAQAVNARLSEPYPGLTWNGLPMANEYPGEVRYFRLPLASAGPLRMGMTACVGAGSYIAFLFSDRGLFRLSYRLITDKSCTDTNQAAQQVFYRYAPIGKVVALSVRYRSGKTEVVDITDSAADYLTPLRWRQGSDQ